MTLRRQATLLALLATLTITAAIRPAPDRASTTAGARIVRLGTSVEGRAINSYEIGPSDATHRVVVIGEIHGDERAGAAVAEKLSSGPPPDDTELWIVPELNPDGAAHRTRQNARGVDLNRNFPWHWRKSGQPFDQQYGGRRALSEPESRIARDLILEVRPEITLWFHQPLGLVDLSGGDGRIERRFARFAGLPARRLARYRGSAVNWQNRRLPSSTAFVAELHAGRLSAAKQLHYARAIRKLIAAQD